MDFQITSMLENLSTEQSDELFKDLDRLPVAQLLAVMNSADAEVAGAVQRALPKIGKAIGAIVAALELGGRLWYIGAGTSGRLGVLDASECPPTFGVPPDLVRGIIAGGEAALSRATEASEGCPACRPGKGCRKRQRLRPPRSGAR